MKIVTARIMKELEAQANSLGVSDREMMEIAGRAVAENIIRMETGEDHCLILCGKGNNAGDALVAARYLSERKFAVFVVFLLGTQLSTLAQENLEKLNRNIVHVYEQPLPEEQLKYIVSDTDVIIDGVFGTGYAGGALPREVQAAFEITNQSKAVKVALDIPSGVACDSGLYSDNTFLADFTYSFAALKPAHILKGSKQFCGRVKVINIGITEGMIGQQDAVELLTAEMIYNTLPARREDSNKGTFGRLLTVGGSYGMPGAISLANMAALRTGVGLVQTAVPKSIMDIAASHTLETTFVPLEQTEQGTVAQAAVGTILEQLEGKTALLIGMGLSVCEDTIAIVQELVRRCQIPMIIDGDGLNCLAKDIDILRERSAPTLLTPHMMEMSRMSGIPMEQVKEHRFWYAREFSRKYQVTLVLKDSNTVISTPQGDQFINDNGNSGLAKGGSGDVLAGMLGSFVAQGIQPRDAAKLAVFMHAHTADVTARRRNAYSMLPHDLIETLGEAFQELFEL